MTSVNKLIFTQLNMNKARSAAIYFNQRFEKEKVHIGILSEPRHISNKIIGLNCGRVLYDDSSRITPRAAIIFKNNIKYFPIFEFITPDLVAAETDIEIGGSKLQVVIASGYHDQTKVTISQSLKNLISYCRKNKKELIYGCDSNSHNQLWGSKTNDKRGDDFLRFISENNLTILNKGGKSTYFTVKKFQNRIKAVNENIDLTICSNFIAKNIIEWQVSDDVSCSDHRYIDFKVKSAKIEPIRYRNPKTTNWELYPDLLREKVLQVNLNITRPEELDKSVEQFVRIIQECYLSSNKEKIIHTNTGNDWWNEDLAELRKEVRKSFRECEVTGDFSPYRAKNRDYVKKIRNAKSKSYKQAMEDLSDISATSKIHKLLSKDHTNKLGTVLKNDGSYTKTRKETLLEMARVHFPGNINLNPNTHSNTPQLNCETDYNLSRELFTSEAVKWAVKSFGSFKSAGPDEIFPALLQRAIDIVSPYLRIFFIKSHAWGYIPKAWREVKVTYIPKAGKRPSYETKSFRPISLSSFLLKTQERILDRHIRNSVLRNRPLHRLQFAYQPGKSTIAALQALKKIITKNFDQKQFALGAFLDIAGAFDNTSFEAITNALRLRGVDVKTSEWIGSMLSGRKVSTKLDDVEIVFNVTRGCPQGGVLSPLLWSLVVDELIEHLNTLGFYTQGYADDIVVIIRGFDSRIVSERMQIALNSIARWCRRKGLSVNPSKTEMVMFTKNRKLRGQPVQLKLFGQELRLKNEVKYLGVIFDKTLTWNSHFSKVIEKATNTLFICKRMAGKLWGLKPELIHWVYTAIVRPIISYAALVWWEKSKQQTARKRLNKLQHLACLMITGSTKTAPTAGMQALLNLTPLHIFLEYEAINMNFRFRCSELNEIKQLTDPLLNRLEEKYSTLRCTLIDDMLKKYNFEHNFSVEIPEPEDWFNGVIDLDEDAEHWYTDGSKIDDDTGYGVFHGNTKTSFSGSMGKHMTVFLAEIQAINACANINLKTNIQNRTIYINSDSEAALHAIMKNEVNSQLVWETIQNLNQLGLTNRLKLRKVPAHRKIYGNEKADYYAKEGARASFKGPEPFTGMPWCLMKACMKKWMYDESSKFWQDCKGNNHGKKFIGELNSGRAKLLLKLRRDEIRLVTGFLTGHFPVGDRLVKMRIAENSNCRFCSNEDEKETIKHILCNCVALERTRKKYFNANRIDELIVNQTDVRTLLKFLKSLNL